MKTSFKSSNEHSATISCNTSFLNQTARIRTETILLYEQRCKTKTSIFNKSESFMYGRAKKRCGGPRPAPWRAPAAPRSPSSAPRRRGGLSRHQLASIGHLCQMLPAFPKVICKLSPNFVKKRLRQQFESYVQDLNL